MIKSTTPSVAGITVAGTRRRAGPLSGASFAAATVVVNLANYGIAVLLGRVLGPEIYGPFASFMALFLFVTLVPSAFQLVAARAVGREEADLRSSSEASVAFGAVVGAVLLAVGTSAAAPIGLPAAWWWALGAAMPGYALLGLARGAVQGHDRLDVLGGNLLLEAVARVALIVLLVSLGFGANGAVAGTLLALPLALWHLRRDLPRLTVTVPRFERAAVTTALPMLGYLAAQAILAHSDVLIANARMGATDAGLFAAVSTVGRILTSGSLVVTTVVFARVAASRGRDLPWLMAALATVLAGSLFVLGWALIAPEMLLTLLFGSAYLGAVGWLATYTVMAGVYAVANVLGSHVLALRGRGVAGLSLGIAAAQLVLLTLVPADASALITAQLVLKGLLAVALIRAVVHARKGAV